MGTINEKISYLQETKTRQKNLINALGGEITNETPFREYEQELIGVLPKVTGEGTNISLSPTIEYDLDVESLLGDTKQATSILPSEYQQVEYVQVTGTYTIDTEIIPTDTTGIYQKFARTGQTDDSLVCGVRESNDSNTRFFGGTSYNTNVAFGWKLYYRLETNGNINMGVPSNPATLDNNEIAEFYMNYNNSRKVRYVNKTKNYDITSTSSLDEFSTTFTKSIYMFGYNKAGTANACQCKIYELKISQGTNLVAYFIPCYKISDNTIGMYDIVRNRFFTGTGTGSFTKGSNVSIPNPNYPQDILTVTGTQEIEVVGKNIYDNSKHNNQWVSPTGLASVSGANIQKVMCSSGDTYTMSVTFESSGGNSVCVMAFYDENDGLLERHVISGVTSGSLIKIAPTNTSYMYVGHYINTPITMQVEKSSTATTYSPYTSQTYTLHLGDEELAKIGVAQDKIYYDNGKWYKYGAIGKVVYTGNETWTKNTSISNSTRSVFYTTKPSDLYDYTDVNSNLLALSNKFISTSQAATWKPYKIGYSKNTNTRINFIVGPDVDLDTFKTTINGTNLYYASTGSTTEITNSTLLQDLNYIKEHISSFPDTTNISSSGDLSSEYQQVEYIKSSGTQFINFPFDNTATNINRYEIKYMHEEAPTQNGTILGNQVVVDDNRIGMLWFTTNNETKFSIGNRVSSSSNFTINNTLNQVVNATITVDNTKTSDQSIIYNGASYLSGAYGGSTKTNAGLKIFGTGSTSQTANVVLYSLKIYGDNILLNNFIPCYRKSDNVIGLYDVVGKQFYTNSGTGTFAKGSNVTELPTIISASAIKQLS